MAVGVAVGAGVGVSVGVGVGGAGVGVAVVMGAVHAATSAAKNTTRAAKRGQILPLTIFPNSRISIDAI
jgi:hypothetical protein